ncbi:hypothetical protein ACHAXT_009878 [Thalassiosira profunda]
MKGIWGTPRRGAKAEAPPADEALGMELKIPSASLPPSPTAAADASDTSPDPGDDGNCNGNCHFANGGDPNLYQEGTLQRIPEVAPSRTDRALARSLEADASLQNGDDEDEDEEDLSGHGISGRHLSCLDEDNEEEAEARQNIERVLAADSGVAFASSVPAKGELRSSVQSAASGPPRRPSLVEQVVDAAVGGRNKTGAQHQPPKEDPQNGEAGSQDGDDGSDGFNVKAAFEKEHKAVRKFKVVVVLVLLAAAIAVTMTVFSFTSKAEQTALSAEYDDYAAKVITNFHHLNVMRQWAAYTVAAMFTAGCVDDYGPAVRPWPNVTLPDYADQVRGAMVLAHAKSIEFSPLFANDEGIRRGWEAYAVENEDVVMHVPSWARRQHEAGHGDHSSHGGDGTVNDGGAHEASHDGDAHGDAGHEQDMASHEMEAGHDHTDESFGPDMAEAVHAAHTDEAMTSTHMDADSEPGVRGLRGDRRAAEQHSQHTGGLFSINMDEALASIGQDAHQHEDKADESTMNHEEHDHDNGSVSEVHAASNSGHDGHNTQASHAPQAMEGDAHVHPRRPIEEGIYTMQGDAFTLVDETWDQTTVPYLAPAWQLFPLIGNEGKVLYNEYQDTHRRRAIDTMLATDRPALTEILYGFADHHHFYADPSSIMLYPVYDTFDDSDENRKMVGFVSVAFSWIGTFWNILPETIQGLVAVIETNTGQFSSFRIDGKHGYYLGEGDRHDPRYDHMRRSSSAYRVYSDENNIKEMVGHHRLMRHLDAMASGHEGHEHVDESPTDLGDEHIDITIHLYPSDDFEACYLTSQPRIFALAVSLVFLVTVASFIIYDSLVERRQKKLLENAERSGKIVSALFPAMVRKRLFDNPNQKASIHEEEKQGGGVKNMFKANTGNKLRLKKFMNAQHSQMSDSETALSGYSPPIADLYTDTTVMFADIAGFTAWSSEREPTQVFQLLESLFSEFDAEARAMKVFKIETIGDCYVAVAGLPEPTDKHACIMAKFAQRCLIRFSELTKELELSLGPGTADLGVRIGLHSGPVTAGVLRGEKARFQLFGDTMNTASRMESTSIKNMIQVTSETASLLKEKGKGHTLIAREGLVKAKGKGYMQTYWLRPQTSSSSGGSNYSLIAQQACQHEANHIHSRALHDTARAELGLPSFSLPSISSVPVSMRQGLDQSWNETGFANSMRGQEGLRRLIKWNTQVLESILLNVVVQRKKRGLFKSAKTGIKHGDADALFHEEIAREVDMPRFNRDATSQASLPTKETVKLIPADARTELRSYVSQIASMYRDVNFHNFEHASHVTMSAQKLINKVVLRPATSSTGTKKGDEEKRAREKADLFFSTYGIAADPLAQFAVVFAALVHDVDHTGVPNVQLGKEKPSLAEKYKSKSLAENNSIRIAWSELLKPEYSNLRQCIFGTDDGESRFRQLLINVVIATDICDRDRRAGERARWETAFRGNSSWEREWQGTSEDQLPSIDISLKATVVLEQIVLASDVAHTMQHWLTYVKWNERLYKEMWAAFASGRAEKDPTEGWYEGEIGFFDGYIIPLATKLKECGVFGNAGDEYLGNALRNKAEWIEKGEAIVAEFEAKIKRASAYSHTSTKTLSVVSDNSSGSLFE